MSVPYFLMILLWTVFAFLSKYTALWLAAVFDSTTLFDMTIKYSILLTETLKISYRSYQDTCTNFQFHFSIVITRALSGCRCNCTQDSSFLLLAKNSTCLFHFNDTYFQVFFSQKRCNYLGSYSPGKTDINWIRKQLECENMYVQELLHVLKTRSKTTPK